MNHLFLAKSGFLSINFEQILILLKYHNLEGNQVSITITEELVKKIFKVIKESPYLRKELVEMLVWLFLNTIVMYL